MYAAASALAAPQVGRAMRVIVLDVPTRRRNTAGKPGFCGSVRLRLQRGCLSLPEHTPAWPPGRIRLPSRPRNEIREMAAQGLLRYHPARMDHGGVLLSTISPLKRNIILRSSPVKASRAAPA
jgi:peptide deformylase